MQDRSPATDEISVWGGERNLAQARRVAGGATFGRAEQLRRLLLWLAARSPHTGAAPSEREIAEAVFHRGDFDPRADTLVRKEMGRLRTKVSRYYASEGVADPILISVGPGYSLTFSPRQAEPPCWLVLPFRSAADLEHFSVELLEELTLGLGSADRVRVIAPATALSWRSNPIDPRDFAAGCRAALLVEGSLRGSGEAATATVWLTDASTGRGLRSTRASASAPAEMAALLVDWLLSGLAG